MFQIRVNRTFDMPVKYLSVDAEVRYWEDARVNGVEDEEGDLIPCVYDGTWCPLINLETGVIENWESGKAADIHYKVCDAGIYTLLDENKETVIRKDGYVPSILSPGGSGYGDYIIMKVDENGKIENWKVNLDYFEKDD